MVRDKGAEEDQKHMKAFEKYALSIVLAISLTGCANTDRFKQNSVWEMYDVRTPVQGVNTRAWSDPQNSMNSGYNSPNVGSVPIDNDAFYIPPTGYVPH